MGNTCKRQVKVGCFFPQCLTIVWGFHKLFLEEVSLICSTSLQFNHDYPNIIYLMFSDSQNKARSLKLSKQSKNKSLEYISLGYLNLFTVLRKFCWYHCTGVSGTDLHPRHGPKQEYFFHEHLTNCGQESWAQNVPGLGFGFVRPSGQGLPSVVHCFTGPPVSSLLCSESEFCSLSSCKCLGGIVQLLRACCLCAEGQLLILLFWEFSGWNHKTWL